MKIVCDSCATKYSIADEKVKGKVFKIRCKKCQHIIVVRGNTSDGEPAIGSASAAAISGEHLSTGVADAIVWHVVINREQVGPMAADEVRQRYAKGELTKDSYIWREGLADWTRLHSVSEFADVISSGGQWDQDEAVTRAAPGMFDAGQGGQEEGQWDASHTLKHGAGAIPFAAPAAAQVTEATNPKASLFDTGDQPLAAAPTAAAPKAASSSSFGSTGGNKLFSDQPASASSGSASLFASNPVAAAAPVAKESASAASRDSGSGGHNISSSSLTGQRGENSVLFSLSNLQAMATTNKPATAASTTKKAPDSGLIDIQGMMSGNTLPASGGGGDLPTLGGFVPSLSAAPVLIPSPVDERPKWLIPVLALGGVIVVGLIALVVILLTQKPTPVYQPAVVQTPAATQVPAQPVTVPTKAAAGAVASDKTTESATKAAEGDKTDKAATETKSDDKDDKDSSRKQASSRSSSRRGGRESSSSREAQHTAAPVASQPNEDTSSKPATKRGAKRDDLDDLIDGAISGGKQKPRGGGREAASESSGGSSGGGGDSNLPDTLSRAQIQSGMQSIKGRVMGCYERFRVPGLATVDLRIAPSGRVTDADVKGIFAGTPTGSCVSSAVRSASFPAFRGATFKVTYPYILR